jgi:hypothetical protein
VVPAQQPLGQLLPLHTQAPPTQRWPALHAGDPPQRQPPAPHESALLTSQATHTAPPEPHDCSVGGVLQVVPEQHPLAQFCGVQPEQTPPEHDCDPGHGWHS